MDNCKNDLNINLLSLGENHTYTGLSYTNIAAIYYNLKEYPLALEYYEKALKIFNVKLGKEHPNTKDIEKDVYNLKQKLHYQD